MTYTPGPGKYEQTTDFQDIIKDKNDSVNYFNTSNGGKLTRRTQWFSADRTNRFATDDKSCIEFKHPSVGPDKYSPKTTISDSYKVKRFTEMDPKELKATL